ncbi:type IIL restriction-modification enzyme MmeI [Tautonia plasticadhaerens]|uniref:type IIL restriction-modification enzyme MmeI n=1 Tax=Tautonia plasticadhaerens TaxID=2527974 RepID=UPI0011A0761F|nr:type IIL restriction-modification enzyme MmeI [Tautonia plasticadhaerens]
MHVYKGSWNGSSFLDNKTVELIDSKLQPLSIEADPQPLVVNAGKSFKGYDIGGLGFTMAPDEYKSFLDRHPEEFSVIHPYINGLDFYSSPTQHPSRYAINFVEMTLEEAAAFPASLQRVRELVKPQRDKASPLGSRERWWLCARNRPAMRRAIEHCDRVLAKTQTSKTWAFSFLPSHYLFDQKLVVIPSDDWKLFAVLQSEIHYFWAERQGSSLKGDMAYTPTDCFQTFPFPVSESLSSAGADLIGCNYYDVRQGIMQARDEGLTATYNRFHNADDTSADIQDLRDLQVVMDQAAATAYGWTDITLDHGFHETKQGVRFTISEPARREVLQRLLKLNHERYAEEVEQGLHGKSGTSMKATPKRKAPSKLGKAIPALFDVEDDDA